MNKSSEKLKRVGHSIDVSYRKERRVQEPTKRVEIIEKDRDHRQGSHALGRVIGHPREEDEYFTTTKGEKKEILKYRRKQKYFVFSVSIVPHVLFDVVHKRCHGTEEIHSFTTPRVSWLPMVPGFLFFIHKRLISGMGSSESREGRSIQ